jgi:hypothetical protein
VSSQILDPVDSISGGREPRLLFGSYHCYWDRSSGAALCTRELLEQLNQRGCSCRAFCGPHLDFEQAPSLAELLDAQHIPFERRHTMAGAVPVSVYHFHGGGVSIQIYDSPVARPFEAATREKGACFPALPGRGRSLAPRASASAFRGILCQSLNFAFPLLFCALVRLRCCRHKVYSRCDVARAVHPAPSPARHTLCRARSVIPRRAPGTARFVVPLN